MEFPADSLIRLLSHQKDIVGCNYMRRNPPYSPTASGMDGKPIMFGTGLVEAKIVPTGLLLIHMDVFKKLTFPWFETPYNDGVKFGEDNMFCAKAILNCGYKIWCDLDLSNDINHLGQFRYNLRQTEGMVLHEDSKS